jgi:putative ABC transport system permease protein
MRSLLRFLGLWRVVYQRLVSESTLSFSLLLGWVAFVALLAAIPMYTDAVNQKSLSRELAGMSSATRPAYGFHFRYVGGSGPGAPWNEYDAARQYLADAGPERLGLSLQVSMHYAKSDLWQVFPSGSQYTGREMLERLNLGFVRDLEQKAQIVEGGLPGAFSSLDAPLEVLASQELASEIGLQVGDELTLFSPLATFPDGSQRRAEIDVRVAGFWVAADSSDPFWYISPASFANSLLLPEQTYATLAASGDLPQALYNVGWYQAYDGSQVRAEDVPGVLRRIGAVQAKVGTLLPGTGLAVSPISALLRYRRAASTQALQLFVFLVPFIGLVIYFIMTVASGAVDRQRLEIAQLKSRGATTSQVFGIYVLQALLVGAIAFLLGPPIGRLIAQAIGATYGFLSFAAREELNVAITGISLRYAAIGVGVAALATVLPSIGASRLTVVGARRESARNDRAPFWQRAYLDLLLMGIAAYGYYLLRNQGYLVTLQSGQETTPYSNPLLFVAPAVFVTGVGLFAVRVFPAIMRLPAWLSAQTTSVSWLLALRNLTRTSASQVGLLLILVLTTALGTFTASAARTMDNNTISQIRYRIGSDLYLREGVGLQELASADPEDEAIEIWAILPVHDHLKAEGLEAVARVGTFPARVRSAGTVLEGRLYGIDRMDFPDVGFFREDFARQTLGDLMNALALNRDGIIVSEEVLSQSGLQVGDVIPLGGLDPMGSATSPFTIVGTVRYFPTAYPSEGHVFVANLDYIFEQLGGEVPYNVWSSVAPGADAETIVSDLEELGYKVLGFEDAQATIAEAQRNPERTGLFGFLSIGFIITIGLSMLAQIIHALLSFRRRFILFGMVRAIGLSKGQLALSLGSELALMTTIGIGLGLYVGLVASHVFVPFLQMGYSEAELVPPFVVTIAWADVAKAVAAMLITSLVTNAGVIAFLSRIRMFEALKMGEALT